MGQQQSRFGSGLDHKTTHHADTQAVASARTKDTKPKPGNDPVRKVPYELTLADVHKVISAWKNPPVDMNFAIDKAQLTAMLNRGSSRAHVSADASLVSGKATWQLFQRHTGNSSSATNHGARVDALFGGFYFV